MKASQALVVCLVLGVLFLGGALATGQATAVHRVWVAATVAIELAALLLALSIRGDFDPGDTGRTTWTLIAGFLGVRLLAEVRLLSFYFDFIPSAIEASPAALEVYTVWLRYLYTAADLLMIAALLATLRSYRSLGLQFGLKSIDWAVIAALATMPLIAFSLRDNMGGFLTGDDPALVTYRLVAVCVGVAVAAMSLGVLRYVTQMGGGSLARIWGAIGVAGFARAGSFVALGVVSEVSMIAADLSEQALLWVFASCWLAAALGQRELARGVMQSAREHETTAVTAI